MNDPLLQNSILTLRKSEILFNVKMKIVSKFYFSFKMSFLLKVTIYLQFGLMEHFLLGIKSFLTEKSEFFEKSRDVPRSSVLFPLHDLNHIKG